MGEIDPSQIVRRDFEFTRGLRNKPDDMKRQVVIRELIELDNPIAPDTATSGPLGDGDVSRVGNRR
jgi:hypothetical protein